jgi:DNA-binding phage protein
LNSLGFVDLIICLFQVWPLCYIIDMERQFRDYSEKLLQDLQNPELAIAYLNEALTDKDPRIFLLALKNICKARGEETQEFY